MTRRPVARKYLLRNELLSKATSRCILCRLPSNVTLPSSAAAFDCFLINRSAQVPLLDENETREEKFLFRSV